MRKFDDPLSNIKIASPCGANWDEMYGSERRRFCGDCKLYVYNLSGMTRTEAEAVIMKAEGRLCVRFYRRADGSVMTRDCPVGWAKIKQRTRAFASALGVLFITLFSGVLFASLFTKRPFNGGLFNLRSQDPAPRYTMGAIAIKPDSDGNAVPPGEYEVGKMAPPKVPGKTMRVITIEPLPLD